MAQHAHQLLLQRGPAVVYPHIFAIQQRPYFAYRHAAFHPALNLFDTLHIFIIKLTMAALCALGL